ncbi:hypothetical protein DB35_13325 [Streptomyces abyssalis]|uniref:Uncharacterized protein n=1 Tax=Streptomyces abyssalis TaxID=933944 RepID=A0A1E7JGP6_9ACTN|nr:nucleotide disphospho-sugar-binding domain-containing protein [Streptomyces abyssalis]OEU85654.1 hypothetical protein AN215_24660 [Streptomyces abyssalis]OEU92882.1 hypothetical protein DB35_13325 [Streptomyces abyssalis]
MRVLMTYFPYPSHLYPMVPLAYALREAGHDVHVASASEEAGTIRAAGLTPVDLGSRTEWRDTAHWADSPLWQAREKELRRITDALPPSLSPSDRTHWDFVRHQFLPVQAYYFTPDRPGGHRPMVDGLVDFARAGRPDLVLWDFTFPTAAVAAHVCGAAHARFTWGLDYLGWAREQFVRWRHEAGPGLGEDPQVVQATAAAARFGLPYSEDMVLGQWTIEATAGLPQLPLETTRMRVRQIPYSQESVTPDWVDAPRSRPRVCLTLEWDSEGRLADTDVALSDVVGALAGLDAEIVMIFPAEQLRHSGPLPANVRAESYVPFGRLLPTCSALVHYGGVGSFAAAVAHSVPQVIIPRNLGNSEALLRHVEDSGAGLGVSLAQSSPAQLTDRIERVLREPDFQRGADRLHSDMSVVPAPHSLVPALEDLTGRVRLPGTA